MKKKKKKGCHRDASAATSGASKTQYVTKKDVEAHIASVKSGGLSDIENKARLDSGKGSWAYFAHEDIVMVVEDDAW